MFCSCCLVVQVQDLTVLCMQAQHEQSDLTVMSIILVHTVLSSPVLAVSHVGYCCLLRGWVFGSSLFCPSLFWVSLGSSAMFVWLHTNTAESLGNYHPWLLSLLLRYVTHLSLIKSSSPQLDFINQSMFASYWSSCFSLSLVITSGDICSHMRFCVTVNLILSTVEMGHFMLSFSIL